MKFLLTLFLFVNTSLACNKSVKSDKVVFFMDVNASLTELESAKEAACKRGESFVSIPKDSVELGKYRKEKMRLQRRFKNCKKSNCEKRKKDLLSYQEKNAGKFEKANIKAELNEALEGLEKKGKSISSLVISGHNGGGNFSSDSEIGRFIGKGDLASALAEYPEVTQGIDSALLLGCYTTVKSEILSWQGILPNAKLIAGYEGKGPLADRPSAYQFIEDVLKNEKKILENAQMKKVKRNLEKSVRNLYDVYGGIYVDVGCNKNSNGKYYFVSQDKNQKIDEFDVSKCEEIRKKGKEFSDVKDYYLGNTEIPKDTANGRVREIYEFSRRNDYCYFLSDVEKTWESFYLANPNNLMKLLFFDSVKVNFGRAYKEEAKALDKYISELTENDIDEVYKQNVAHYEEQTAKAKEFYDEYMRSPEAYQASINSYIDSTKDTYDNLINNEVIQKLGYPNVDFNLFSDLPEQLKNELVSALNFMSDYDKYQQIHNEIEKNGLDSFTKQVENNFMQTMQVEMNFIKNRADVINAIRVQKRPWPLTEEVLKTKSRKEILDNLHELNQYRTFFTNYEMSGFIGEAESKLSSLQTTPDDWYEVLENPRDSLSLGFMGQMVPGN